MQGAEALRVAARQRLEQRRAEAVRTTLEETEGPQGESLSRMAAGSMMVNVADIVEDPDFENLRLLPSEDEYGKLVASMRNEGLRVPVTLIPSADLRHFHARAGFRRLRAARELGWVQIPAVILPRDTPRVTQAFTNIIENTSRERLSTYELAVAARYMRDEFGVSPREFAVKAGCEESYAYKLLRCITRLPDEIIKEWRETLRFPVEIMYGWAAMTPEEAASEMHKYDNRHRTLLAHWNGKSRSARKSEINMASAEGLRRMKRLEAAIETCRAVSERERSLMLAVVRYCTGATSTVDGIYGGARVHVYRSRRREDRERQEHEDMVRTLTEARQSGDETARSAMAEIWGSYEKLRDSLGQKT